MIKDIAYVVIKSGVYRHDIFGVFLNKDEAKKVANKLAETDSDNYHTYDVIKTSLDQVAAHHEKSEGHSSDNDTEIYSTSLKVK